MPDWTYDTQIELTDAGRNAVYFPEVPELETEDKPLPCEPEDFGFCPNCGGKLDAFEMCDTRKCLLQEKK